MRVLLVVNDKNIQNVLKECLQAKYTLTTLSYIPSNVSEFELVIIHNNDLGVVYDIMKIRSKTNVLLLTCGENFSSIDIAKILDSGADNHLPTPINTGELELRIAALKRLVIKKEVQLTVKDLCLNRETRQVTRLGKPVLVSVYGYKILEFLSLNKDRTVNDKELCEHLYSAHNDKKVAVLRSHVSILRKALQSSPNNKSIFEYITSIRNKGYIISN